MEILDSHWVLYQSIILYPSIICWRFCVCSIYIPTFPDVAPSDKLIVSCLEKWDVLNDKTAAPLDVLQNPNRTQLLALGA